jgi:hypothetical protein
VASDIYTDLKGILWIINGLATEHIAIAVRCDASAVRVLVLLNQRDTVPFAVSRRAWNPPNDAGTRGYAMTLTRHDLACISGISSTARFLSVVRAGGVSKGMSISRCPYRALTDLPLPLQATDYTYFTYLSRERVRVVRVETGSWRI